MSELHRNVQGFNAFIHTSNQVKVQLLYSFYLLQLVCSLQRYSRGKSNLFEIALAVCGNQEKGLATYLSVSGTGKKLGGVIKM